MGVLRQSRLTDKGAFAEQSILKTLLSDRASTAQFAPEQEVRAYSSLPPSEYGENPSWARSTDLNARKIAPTLRSTAA